MELDINRVAVMRNGHRCKILTLDCPGGSGPARSPVVVATLLTGDLFRLLPDGTSLRHDDFDIVSQEPADTPQAPRPKIDIKKPVKTRDGQEVTVISDQCRMESTINGQYCQYPLVGHIGKDKGLSYWTTDGQYTPACGNHVNDLVQENEVWVVIRHNGCPGVFSGRNAEQAAKACGDHRARIRVPYVIGQFD